MTALALPPTSADQPDAPPRLVPVIRHAAAITLLLAVALLQAPGRVVADTKLDLTVDPGGWLASSLSVWDPSADFGRVQNQSYGYLWPSGPFFWLGDALGLPSWLVQRLWWSLLLITAYAGVVLLLRRLGLYGSVPALLAGLAYALSPRVLTVLGGISVEAWPGAVLPWILLPIVAIPAGAERRRAAWSGIAVLMLGAVNAAATALVLVLPLLWLLTAPTIGRRPRALAWWSLAVALACAWWVVPLIVLSRHAFPFLDLIETASITTSPTSLLNSWRGTSHWIAWTATGSGPTWPAGATLSLQPLPAVATVLVATAGAVGLVSRALPGRRPLGLAFVVGMTGLAVAHTGSATSPLAPLLQDLLDGPLSPLRNVHKWDPLVRLPLCLGLAAVASVPLSWRRAVPEIARIAPALSVGVLLAAAVMPAAAAGLANPRPYAQLPDAWRQASDWIEKQNEGELIRSRTLVLPAARFAEQLWGTTRDEIVQPLLHDPWLVRSAIPLGAPGATSWLGAVETRFGSGTPDRDLAAMLADAGVGRVLVRTDLDPRRADAESWLWARATLASSPGFVLERSIGDTNDVRLEVWRVLPRPTVVQASAASTLTVGVGAGPSAVATGGPIGPVVLAPDLPQGLDPSSVLVGDDLRRQAYNPGLPVSRAYSATLPVEASPPAGRGVLDVLPEGLGPLDQTVLTVGLGVEVTASSSASDPFDTVSPEPIAGPAAAFDDDPQTAWRPADGEHGTISVVLPAPMDVGAVTVQTPTVPADGRDPTLRVDGRTTPMSRVADGSLRAVLEHPVSRLEVDVSEGGAVASLRLEGAAVESRLATPRPPHDGLPTVISLTADQRSRAACVPRPGTWVCDEDLRRSGEDDGRLARDVVVAGPVAPNWSVAVRPAPGPALDAALDEARWGADARISGSSTVVSHPAARPGAALDGDPSTAWVPRATDVRPQLVLELPARQVVDGVTLDDNRPRQPRQVTVSSEEGSRSVSLAPGERRTIEPLGGQRFIVTVQTMQTDIEPGAAPLEIREIGLVGLSPEGADLVEVPCGLGPTLTVDGRAVPVAVTADPRDVVAGASVPARLCGVPAEIGPGRHSVVGSASDGWRVVEVRAGQEPQSTASRGVTGTEWSSEHRELVVAPGPEAVLRVAESAEDGWVATAGGMQLTPVRVMGWQQGWVLPASNVPLSVTLSYPPGDWHRMGLLGGVGAAVLLLVLAAVPSSRPCTREFRHQSGGMSAPVSVAVATTWTVLVCGAAGVLVAVAAAVIPPGRRRLVVGIAGVGSCLPLLLVLSRGAGASSDTIAHAAGQLLVALVVATVLRTALEPQQRPLHQVPGEGCDHD